MTIYIFLLLVGRYLPLQNKSGIFTDEFDGCHVKRDGGSPALVCMSNDHGKYDDSYTL